MTAGTVNQLDARCDAACAIAREAGGVARHYFRAFDRLEAKEKGVHDLVTAADIAVDQSIRTRLSDLFPHDGILSEESAGGGADRLWIVDPIDGTGNFARGLAHFAISIAYRRSGAIAIGVIYDVMADEMFVARRGGGASCNGKPIRVNAAARPGAGLIEAGYSSRHPFSAYLDRVRAMDAEGYALCQRGSAALGLAHVACARLDGYWELDLFCWDVFAGLLLVQEAGGWISAFEPSGDLSMGKPVLACARPLASPLQRITRSTEWKPDDEQLVESAKHYDTDRRP